MKGMVIALTTLLASVQQASAICIRPLCSRSVVARKRTTSLRAELGLQVDPLASAGSLFVLGGFTILQLKIRSAIEKRESRDSSAETLRKAEVLLLAGKLDSEGLERARAAFKAAAAEYEDTRRIVSLGGVLLRIPDPGAAEADRLLDRTSGNAQPPIPPPAPTLTPVSKATKGELDQLDQLGLNRPNLPSSLLPTASSSVTLKDVAIGFAFLLQIGWFLLSLTDPIGEPNPILNAALSAGGNFVDEREARRAAESAEYKAMLRDAVERGEAPPLCATRKLGDPFGGCTDAVGRAGNTDPEFQRVRGLDANRAWISGPPS